MTVPLHIITGFLGAGKTTLLNRLLEAAQARSRKIGVIVNEWGQVNIDGRLLAREGLEMRELNNGQLFCSCLSGNFVQALAQFAARPLDAVFVETSGMANPLPLARLLAEMEALTGSHYDYRGMTVLVDPQSFPDLVEVLPALREQVVAGQRIIVNKADLADADELRRTREAVRALNAGAEIIETSHARADGLLEAAEHCEPAPPPLLRPLQPPEPRPAPVTVAIDGETAPERVLAFARDILPLAFRIKGIVRGPDNAWGHLDGVGETLRWRPLPAQSGASEIVIIARGEESPADRIAAAWRRECGTPFTLTEGLRPC